MKKVAATALAAAVAAAPALGVAVAATAVGAAAAAVRTRKRAVAMRGKDANVGEGFLLFAARVPKTRKKEFGLVGTGKNGGDWVLEGREKGLEKKEGRMKLRNRQEERNLLEGNQN